MASLCNIIMLLVVCQMTSTFQPYDKKTPLYSIIQASTCTTWAIGRQRLATVTPWPPPANGLCRDTWLARPRLRLSPGCESSTQAATNVDNAARHLAWSRVWRATNGSVNAHASSIARCVEKKCIGWTNSRSTWRRTPCINIRQPSCSRGSPSGINDCRWLQVEVQVLKVATVTIDLSRLIRHTRCIDIAALQFQKVVSHCDWGCYYEIESLWLRRTNLIALFAHLTDWIDCDPQCFASTHHPNPLMI